MDERSFLVLQKIIENKSLQEIAKELKINYRILFSCLKKLVINGYNFDKKYFSNGNIFYNLNEEHKLISKDRVNIDIVDGKDSFRTLFIADLHVGHKNDRLDVLPLIYEYAMNRNINTVIIVGDIIENIYANNDLRLNSVKNQVECFTKEYPCSKQITNFALYGNHDFYSLKNDSYDVADEIEKERPDIVNIGYGSGLINLKNDCIKVEHYISPHHSCKNSLIPKITFLGHSHMYKVKITKENRIFLPSLSDAFPSNYGSKPLKGFLDVSFTFTKEGLIRKVIIKNLVLYHGLNLANETSIKIRKK